MSWLEPVKEGCILTVKAVPRASRTEVAGIEGEWIRIRLLAPPVDGKANAALTAFLSKKVGCPKGSVEVIGGTTARLKRVRLHGVTPEMARTALES
ncbi:MAG: DUF167 domain-containing protein [Kiritimatiellae bacterium]|nr:DUF167 domain-containing protein [Kiritimatiellia bacterium]